VTAHCHAATAQLTREYQGDHRRYSLTPTTTQAAVPLLDISFHISRLLKNPRGLHRRRKMSTCVLQRALADD
jgi:hypothetical protein